jgi:hypothetical protein
MNLDSPATLVLINIPSEIIAPILLYETNILVLVVIVFCPISTYINASLKLGNDKFISNLA